MFISYFKNIKILPYLLAVCAFSPVAYSENCPTVEQLESGRVADWQIDVPDELAALTFEYAALHSARFSRKPSVECFYIDDNGQIIRAEKKYTRTVLRMKPGWRFTSENKSYYYKCDESPTDCRWNPEAPGRESPMGLR